MLEETHAFYGDSSQYTRGEIVVMTSPDAEKGILLSMTGRESWIFRTC